MPSKNTIKIYIKDGIYHIYNRTIDNLILFRDEEDYKIFLYYLKSYLTPLKEQSSPPPGIKFNKTYSLYDKIRLMCYCLMPNHYHLMVQQKTERAISEFIKRLINAYTEYYNKKYKRRGPIFEGRYKGKLVRKEKHFLYLPYYIHHNPEKLYENNLGKEEKIKNYSWSSYGDYLGERNASWIYKKDLMEQFLEAEDEKLGLDKVKEILGDIIIETT